ncbi:glutathione S-transferase N-terminal domain-containing protein [Lysobacter solisilvae (ex Woo and Kim 2022)]|uniref:Glutathione S-transferase N-terminal domain-containing protein n=1 Tax=Agrilutibacter terrestris TaxID=2865112 RepID=A0A7H0FV83_9GAMM|nr:glutathione S-transferase N-terminal domain-containing protein [Lysobacter terrestris]QNP39949.1 glutathione S-transferase N-terminal domain-containing protein [Lysobacter terrestris]
MKLYSSPGACSTADHIVLEWAGGPFEVEVVTREQRQSPEYLAINPAGAVPALRDGDFLLTQNAAILGYIADTWPNAHLAGDGSARQRAEANRWLAFVNSDLHPAFKPIFGPGRYIADASQYDAVKEQCRKLVRAQFERANQQLEGKQWLAGFRSYADPYLYITLRWAAATGIDLGGLDNLAAFKQRMDADPGVQAALKAEGLT